MKIHQSLYWSAAAGLLAAVPFAFPHPYYLHLLIVIGIYAIVIAGMDLLVGYTGQVSLGQAAFFGVGSYTAGLLFTKLGLPFALVVPAAIAVSVLFGIALAAASLRVSGPYLAMVTLAFGTIVQILINEMSWVTNGPVGLEVRKPVFFGYRLTTFDYYFVVLGFLAVSLWCVDKWAKSYVGRAFEALRDSPVATACMGVSVARYKAVAFALSAGFAGLGGALYAFSENFLSPNTYSFELSILFLLGVIFGGRKSRVGSVLGATVVIMLPTLLDNADTFRWLALASLAVAAAYAARRLRLHGREAALQAFPPVLVTMGLVIASYLIENLNEHRLTIFGLLILLVVFYLPDGIMGLARNIGLKRHERVEKTVRPATASDGYGIATPPGKRLAIDNITMQFGGLKALRDVSLEVEPGTIHGLIGPNGSGKSTMVNVLTGIYSPTLGSVRLQGEAISSKAPAYIARSGIARTFQNVQLFWEMTALQNVLVGYHHKYRSGLLQLAACAPGARSEEEAAARQAMALLDLVGLGGLAHEEARNLPYGKQRLLEIARALALHPSILLLDEPAAGLTGPDVVALTKVIERISSLGIAIVLIEHHVDMVMRLCDRISVLDFGQKIAEGNSAAVQNDPKVINAYLGAEV